MSSRSLGSLTIDLIAKIAGFEQGMDKAARTADKEFRRMEARAVAFGTAVGNIASKGLGLLGRGLLTFAHNTIKSEQELAQLEAILKSTGNAAGYSRDQLISMADGLQLVSTFATGEIIEAQTRLLSYSGIVGENIPRAMQAVIDQSARLGMSLSQSAETIGRALESPAKAAAALAQQGFGAAFTKEVRATIDALVEAGREADAQILILEILEESYGGAAEAARNTLGGALSALKNTIADLLTGDEGSFDVLTKAINDLNKALNDPGFKRATAAIGQAFADLAADIARSVEPMMREIRGVGTVIEGLGLQAEASADQMRALFSLDWDGMIRSREKALQAAELLRSGLQGALGGHMPNLFANVQSGVSSSMDAGRTVDTTGLVLKDPDKRAKRERTEVDKLQQAYERLMQSMHQRIELFGKEGEAASVRYEIEHGSLKGISDALAQQAIQRAEQIDHMEKVARLQKAADEAAKREMERIQDGLKAGKELLSDLQFELELMRMTNAERATAIQLRGLEKEAVAEYGAAIAEANRRIEEEMENVRFMDGIRGEFSDFFTDVITGTESVTDAFKSMLDSIARMITQRIAERWVEQLFGDYGSSSGGSTGGWFSALMGMFGGGKAAGGWAQANTIYEVNERGLEMATVKGRDYLLTGNSPVHITPNHRLGGGGGGNVTQNFYNPVMSNIQTDQQRAREEARKAQRATARLA